LVRWAAGKHSFFISSTQPAIGPVRRIFKSVNGSLM
jgi:hypothetical protein